MVKTRNAERDPPLRRLTPTVEYSRQQLLDLNRAFWLIERLGKLGDDASHTIEVDRVPIQREEHLIGCRKVDRAVNAGARSPPTLD